MYADKSFSIVDVQTIAVTYGIDRDFSDSELLQLMGSGNLNFVIFYVFY